MRASGATFWPVRRQRPAGRSIVCLVQWERILHAASDGDSSRSSSERDGKGGRGRGQIGFWASRPPGSPSMLDLRRRRIKNKRRPLTRCMARRWVA